jgi:hypothetical protein
MISISIALTKKIFKREENLLRNSWKLNRIYNVVQNDYTADIT